MDFDFRRTFNVPIKALQEATPSPIGLTHPVNSGSNYRVTLPNRRRSRHLQVIALKPSRGTPSGAGALGEVVSQVRAGAFGVLQEFLDDRRILGGDVLGFRGVGA
jgi:hypothetical protein